MRQHCELQATQSPHALILGLIASYDATFGSQTSHFSTSVAYRGDSLQDDLIVIPMPQLSPHMSSGRITKWLKKAGDEISTYDVLFEVETDSLSEEAYKVGDFAGSVTMLVEVGD